MIHALANGLRTDHPEPGLPFVDDSMLDLNDPPSIEAIGRWHGEEGLWGRADYDDNGGWKACTTIPDHPELAWLVKHHPKHGTVISLLRDEDIAAAYGELPETRILTRRGGYWWDGEQWFRPDERHDPVTGETSYTPVPHCLTVTVAALASTYGTPAPSEPLTVADMAKRATATQTPTKPLSEWARHDLGAWRDHHSLFDRPATVTLTAMELDSEAMLTVSDVAERKNVSTSTVRAYLSRGQMPEPQSTNPPMWSKPVIETYLKRSESAAVPAPDRTQSQEILVTMGRDIMRLLGKRGVRQIGDQEIADRLGMALAPWIIGLTNNPLYAAEINADHLVADYLTGTSSVSGRYFGDLAVDHFIMLAETAPSIAKDALRRTLAKLMAQDHDRETVLAALYRHPFIQRRHDLTVWIDNTVTPS